MFGLLFILVVLLGLLHYFSTFLSQKKEAEQVATGAVEVKPTSNFTPPTGRPVVEFVSPTIADQKSRLLALPYPIKYQTIMIDYLYRKKNMVVYYPENRVQATVAMRNFLSQYGVTDSTQLGITTYYIGLTKDAEEPAQGAKVGF